MGETQARGQNLLTLRIIWGSLLMSIAIYGVVAAVVAKTMTATVAGGAANPIVLVLGVAALVMAVMAIFVPRAAMRRGGERAPIAPPDPSAPPSVPPNVFTALIIRWAMLEAVAILGLVAALIIADPRAFIPLGAVAIAGMLLSYPGDSVAARA
ncbi:MAG TPA: hypothetical protein VGF40_11225 [Thermoanaerobaculia bacterium]